VKPPATIPRGWCGPAARREPTPQVGGGANGLITTNAKAASFAAGGGGAHRWEVVGSETARIPIPETTPGFFHGVTALWTGPGRNLSPEPIKPRE